MLEQNQWKKMRTKLQIAKRYLKYLNTQKNLDINIEESTNTPEKIQEVIDMVMKDLYETETINGQLCSTVRAWYIFCDVVVYKDIATSQRIWNGFVKKQFEMIERNTKTVYLAPRSHGKTIHEDTLISTDKGWKPVKDVNVGDKVQSLNENYKSDIKLVSSKTKSYKKKLYNLKTNTGREIMLSADHPLFTINGWQNIKQGLEVGNYIAIPRDIRLFGKNKDYKIARLLGLIVSEGHTGKNRVIFSNNDFELHKEIRNICDYLGVKYSKINKRNDKETFISNSLYKLFPELRGRNSYTHEVPQYVLEGDKQVVKEFLRYIFEGDGGVDSRHSVSYSSMSKKLCSQLQILLQQFGVQSVLRDKFVKFNNKIFHSYRISINATDVLRYKDEVGFVSERKSEILNKICKELVKTKRNPNIDVIPRFGYFENHYIGGQDNFTRYSAKRYVKSKEKMNVNRANPQYREDLLKMIKGGDLSKLKKLTESEIFWDKIVEIREVGIKNCYDLQVEDGDNNYVANGLFVHNSFISFCMYPIFKSFLIKGFEAMLISNIPRMVKNNFRVLKRIIDNNELLLMYKDDSNKKELIWSQDKIGYNDGLIVGFSIGTPPIGSHVNYVAIDDPLRHDKKYPDEYYLNYVDAQVIPTLKRKKGRLVLDGTPIHEEDLIHQCMWDKNNQIITDGRISDKGFYSMRFQAYNPLSKTPEKTLLLPEVFTYEELQELRRTMGEYRFNREYLCICQVNKNALINRKMWRRALNPELSLINKGEKDKQYVIFVDSATSDSQTADWSAFIVMEYDEEKKEKIVRHIWHGKGVRVDEQINELASLHHRFNKAPIYVEKNNAGIAIIQGLDSQGVMVIEHYTRPDTKPKMVQDLLTDFGNGVIVIPGNFEDFETEKYVEKLKHECLNYGVKKKRGGESFEALAGHDDLVDALWGAAYYCTALISSEPYIQCGNYQAFN